LSAPVLPLLIGAALGLAALLALALVYSPRGMDKNWRGGLNAVAVGLALGAMFDLIPLALEQLTVIVGTLMRALFVDLFALQNTPLGIGGAVITQAAVPAGALFILFLYLTGNTLPLIVDGKLVGHKTDGWRARVAIPQAGSVDVTGIALLTIGLAMQNLWVGQQRGAQVSADAGLTSMFLYLIALVAALRGLALFGPFVAPAQRVVAFILCVLGIAAPVVLGVTAPDTMRSVALGVLPAFIGVLVLPVAMGRLLRVVQYDIGMNWQATLILVVTLALERSTGALLSQLAAGQI
jgi:hypothetical protein